MMVAAGLQRQDPVLDAAVDLRLRLDEIRVVPSYGRLGVRRGLGGANEPMIASRAIADRSAGVDHKPPAIIAPMNPPVGFYAGDTAASAVQPGLLPSDPAAGPRHRFPEPSPPPLPRGRKAKLPLDGVCLLLTSLLVAAVSPRPPGPEPVINLDTQSGCCCTIRRSSSLTIADCSWGGGSQSAGSCIRAAPGQEQAVSVCSRLGSSCCRKPR
jgi:hypothetical protein